MELPKAHIPGYTQEVLKQCLQVQTGVLGKTGCYALIPSLAAEATVTAYLGNKWMGEIM